jgi:MATE family multidrug resistance protein
MLGDTRTLIRTSLPFFLFLFCESLTAFGERVFLSYQGVENLSGVLNAVYLSLLFQIPCMAVASMAQVFVGLYQGGGELKKIGPCVWQLVWFSLLSLIVTLPLSLWMSSLFFQGTSIERVGRDYFNILAFGNFLFPLQVALSSFYLGRGKTRLVSLTLLVSYALNLGLCVAFIFGIDGLLFPMGAQGAALAKCLSMGLCCAIFFGLFLKEETREVFGSGCWQFSLKESWVYIQPGMMRALGYFFSKAGWVVISYIMLRKGGLYLDVQTVGGVIITFLTFIPTSIYRSILTIAPNLLGGKNYPELWRLCRSLVAYSMLLGVGLIIPFFLYPQFFGYFFDTASREVFERAFAVTNHWVWLWLVTNLVYAGLCGLIVTTRDLRIQLYSYLATLVTSLLPVYLTLHVWSWGPDKLWLIMTLENVIFSLIFFYRFRRGKWMENHISHAQSEPT